MVVPKRKSYSGPIRHTRLSNQFERIYAGDKIKYSNKCRSVLIQRKGFLGKDGTIDFAYEKDDVAHKTIKLIISGLQSAAKEIGEHTSTINKLRECDSCIYVFSVESALRRRGCLHIFAG